jgi:hypothetical protein
LVEERENEDNRKLENKESLISEVMVKDEVIANQKREISEK